MDLLQFKYYKDYEERQIVNYSKLKDIYNKYDLKKYINLFQKYTVFQKKFAIFYLEKRNLFSRLNKFYACKYRFFMNVDIEYGKIQNERFFSSIDESVDFLWKQLCIYSIEKKYEYLLKIIKEEDKL